MAKKPFRLQLNLRIERLKMFNNKQSYNKLSCKRGVAFTGSREVLSSGKEVQIKVLYNLLNNVCCRNQSYEDMELSHGDCLGWDAIADKLAKKLHIRTYIHPPVNQANQAFCKDAFRTYKPKPYLDRNKDIVDSRNTLIAVSSTMQKEWRSGTWSTIRYARKKNKRIFIILPNGALISEGV